MNVSSGLQDPLIELQQPPPQLGIEFNDVLVESIDESITVLLSRQVMDALYLHLHATYSVSRDELPYKLDTLCKILQKTFGTSAQTIGQLIARRFYQKLQLEFTNHPNHTLLEYVDEAKKKLQIS